MSQFFEEYDEMIREKRRKVVDYNEARILHADAGAYMTSDYEPESAYFTVLNDNGKVIQETHDVGPVWAVEAEYRSIEWAIKQTDTRPLIVTNDNKSAISWAYKGADTDIHQLPPLIEPQVKVKYKKHNLADIYNADNIASKSIPDEYRE
ncbi:MAG: hypothetical protein ABEI13_01165 [Candidatus Paceibacteria bacterium]